MTARPVRTRPVRSGLARSGIPARTLRTPADLVAAGLAPAGDAAELGRVAAAFAVAVTPDMAGLIDPSDPDDPIARQFVPDPRELLTTPAERADPIGDDAHSPVPGVVHRYPDRVLLKAVSVCPVYCRFCFRRETVGPGGDGAMTDAELDAAAAYVAARPDVREVILTGGDPFVLSPRRMAAVVGRLASIPHLDVVRAHTRVPVVEPARVTDDLVRALRVPGKASWVVLHANHARELSSDAVAAVGRLVDGGVPVLAQTVLLRGVNDDARTLEELFRALVRARVKPHYLHHGDLARGTRHFRTTLARGRALVRSLRGRVSGLCQPTYVLDIPGGHGKVPAAAAWVEPDGHGWRAEDPTGRVHAYRDDADPD